MSTVAAVAHRSCSGVGGTFSVDFPPSAAVLPDLGFDIPSKPQPAADFFPQLKTMWFDQSSREQLLAVNGESAERLVEVTQRLLDTLDPAERFRRCALYLLLKLGIRNGLFPSSLFIKGVELGPTRVPVAGGGFSDIYKGIFAGRAVAIKRFRVFGAVESTRCQTMLRKEALVWRQLKHPHVLQFLGFGAGIFPDDDRLCLVSPWMENGTLCEYITQSVQYNARSDSPRLIAELASALAYLHSNKIVHGDLHGANVLIDAEGHALLSDFGLCVVGEATAGRLTQSTANTEAGHVCYMAPERLSPDTQQERWQPAVDVYAFACVCYLLFTGRHPFHDLYLRGQCSVMLAVGRGEIPTRPTDNECLTETTDAIWSLIQECWQREPGTRPSMLSIIQHLSIADTFAPTRAVCHLPKYPGTLLSATKSRPEEPTNLIPALRTASSRIGVVACDFCRSRQIQCDGMQPTCTPCQRHQLPCSLRYLAVIPCDACRESGIGCDSVHPTCSSCEGKDMSCNYMNDPNPHTPGNVTGTRQLLSQLGAPETQASESGWCRLVRTVLPRSVVKYCT